MIGASHGRAAIRIALLSEWSLASRKEPGKMTTAIRPAVVSEATSGPRVHVNAIAAIVRDLLAGGRGRLQDGLWLCERMRAANLDRQECAALEALQVRLRAQSTTGLSIEPTRLWY